MNKAERAQIQAIHDSPTRTALVTAGAGSAALADLLAVPGASRTLLEALVPYAAASFADYLGREPDQYVSEETARALAGRALIRARLLREIEEWPLVGIACTATIVTDRPKRGEHRAHVAAWAPARLIVQSIQLEKGARDRAGEEDMVSHLLLNMLAEACDVAQRLPLRTGDGDESWREVFDFEAAAIQLHEGQLPYFGIHADGRLVTTEAQPQAILSGSFNPLHEGHTGLARAAAGILERPVAFEIAAVNADKPPLETGVLLDRLSQFAGTWPVLASNAPTFVEKSRLYPGATFVVGFDTAARVIESRFYDDSAADMLAALSEIRANNCRFLVAGRIGDDGVFRELDDLNPPEGYADLFAPIPDEAFRRDLSSTEIRAGRA